MKLRVALALLAVACAPLHAATMRFAIPQGNAEPNAVFDFSPNLGSGVHRLSSTDAFSLTTVIKCDARTATEAAGWACTTGGTLTENPSTATAVTGAAAPFTEQAARATVTSGANAAWEGATTSVGDITTEDFRVITIARVTARSSQQQIAGKLTGSTGYRVGVSAANAYIATVNATTITASTTVDTFGQWDILDLQCDRSAGAGSMRLYQNGYLVASGVCPSATATALSSKFTIAANSDAAGVGFVNGNVAYVEVRKGTDAFTTTAAMDAAAQQLAQEIMGVWPERAVTAAPLSTNLRDSVASVDIDRDRDGIVRLFRVGPKWLRVAQRRDTTYGNTRFGGSYSTGYLSETVAVNQLDANTDLSNAAWTKLTSGDSVVTERYFAPDGAATGDRLTGAVDAVAKEHGVRNTSATLEASNVFVFSAFIFWDTTSAVTKQFVWLRDNTVGATAVAWFDLYACQVAGYGAGLYAFTDPPMRGITAKERSARAEYWGELSSAIHTCRVMIAVAGTAATHDFDIGVSDSASATTSTIGSAGTLIGIWGAQVEKVSAGRWATTPVYTAASSTATRNADGLQFDIANVPREHMLAWGARFPNSRVGSNIQTAYVCSPFKDANNNLLLKTTQSTGNAQRGASLTQGAGGGVYADVLNGGTSQLNCCGNAAGFGQWYTPGNAHQHDGQEHRARGVFFDDDVRVYVDGDQTSGITDTGATMPDLSSGGHLDVGYEDTGDQNQGNGVITYCRVYRRDFEPTFP